MAPISTKRRRGDDEPRRPKKKMRIKKQKVYHSSSEEDENEDPAARLQRRNPIVERVSKPKSIMKQEQLKPQPPAVSESDAGELDEEDTLAKNTALNAAPAPESESDEDNEVEEQRADVNGSEAEEEVDDTESDSETSMTSSNAARTKKKRNDPSAFATSISKILDTKLTTSKRSDPVLSRSKSASDANKTLADSKLEQKARAQIRHERRTALEKGRVKDVLGLDTEGVDTGKILEEEKRLKKTAQRGVVKLFNAVRAAQVKAEEAMRQAKSEGVVGFRQREEKVNEMSKQGFLDLISSGGKQPAAAA